jgi:hypothetical protein
MGGCSSTDDVRSREAEVERERFERERERKKVLPSNVITSGDFTLRIKNNYQYVNLISNDPPYYFPLLSGSEYSIVLANNGPAKCDAKVEIDGQFVGLWRVEAYSSLETERPLGVQQKFTWGKPSSQGQVQDSKNSDPTVNQKNGQIRVTFSPEVYRGYNQPSIKTSDREQWSNQVNLGGSGEYRPDLNRELYSGGSTTLGQHSNQIFNVVAPITEIDQSKVTVIDARMVVKSQYA